MRLNRIERNRCGLAALVSALGGPVLAKPKTIQVSNWAKKDLSPRQIEYAALDAYASGWAAAQVLISHS